MAKKRNPVYLICQSDHFEVETREGTMKGKPGDFLAYDPISGDVWVIGIEYAKIHYENF